MKINIRQIMDNYAIEIQWSKNDTEVVFFFESSHNAKLVKRIMEIDKSNPNATTEADFVEVVRCRDCKYFTGKSCKLDRSLIYPYGDDFCKYGERKKANDRKGIS